MGIPKHHLAFDLSGHDHSVRQFGPAGPPGNNGGNGRPGGHADPPDQHGSQAFRFEVMKEMLEPESSPLAADLLEAESLPSELFRLLRTRIRSLGNGRELRALGFISAAADEGKTTSAIGAAFSFAQEHRGRALLIEADLRRPSIERYLGLTRRVGLSEFLQANVSIVPVRELQPDGPCLLGAGRRTAKRSELLGTDRMASLIESARKSFQTVVVDCPPLMPLADSVLLEEILDGFVLVIRAGHSPREAILRAVSTLKEESIVGVVFNDHREILRKYDTYGYQAYAG